MQIVTSNLVATNALWTALIGLADASVTVEQHTAERTEPYSVLHVSHDNIQHLVITGNNAGIRITRTVNTNDTVHYQPNGNHPFAILVHKHLGVEGQEEVEATTYLAALIEFVGFYRSHNGAEFRREVAAIETRHAEIAVVKSEFLTLLASVKNNPLELRRFYNTHGGSDIDQLLSTIDLDPGVYSYTPLDQGLKATHVVFVSRNSRNVLVAYLHDGLPALQSTNDALASLIKELGLNSGQVVKALQDESSAVYQIFDKPQVPQENEHTLDSLIAALDPGSMFNFTSPNRDRMFAGTRLGSALRSTAMLANLIGAIREGTAEVPEGERRPGCFCGRCKA